MNKKLSLALAVLATSAIASAAQAADQVRWPNWYVGVHGGMNFRADGDVNNGGVVNELESDTGYAVGASIGYLPPTTVPFFNNSRWELEYTYRANDNKAVGAGDITSNNYYANVYYDFNNDTNWTPYLGAGAGMSQIDFSVPGLGLSGDDNVFGWQLMAGVSYSPTSLPNTQWSIGYRYQNTFDDMQFIDDLNVAPGVFVSNEVETENHGIEISARFLF